MTANGEQIASAIVMCPGGKVPAGGGFDRLINTTSSDDTVPVGSRPYPPNGWIVEWDTNAGTGTEFLATVYVRCANP